MSRKILDYDPLTKTKTTHYYDNSSGKTYLKYEQDCQDIIDYNKRKQNSHNSSRFSQKGDYYHFATVPLTVLLDWKTKYGLDYTRKEDMPKIERLLMSNEYKYLRTVDRI